MGRSPLPQWSRGVSATTEIQSVATRLRHCSARALMTSKATRSHATMMSVATRIKTCAVAATPPLAQGSLITWTLSTRPRMPLLANQTDRVSQPAPRAREAYRPHTRGARVETMPGPRGQKLRRSALLVCDTARGNAISRIAKQDQERHTTRPQRWPRRRCVVKPCARQQGRPRPNHAGRSSSPPRC